MGPELALKEVAQRLFEEQAEETMEVVLRLAACIRSLRASYLKGALEKATLRPG